MGPEGVRRMEKCLGSHVLLADHVIVLDADASFGWLAVSWTFLGFDLLRSAVTGVFMCCATRLEQQGRGSHKQDKYHKCRQWSLAKKHGCFKRCLHDDHQDLA